MDDSELLEQLADVARQEAPLDPRLERLAAGALSEEEQAALTKEAETDPELAAQIELHRPLDAAILERIGASVQPAPPRASARWLRIVPPVLLAAAAVLFAVVGSGPAALPDYEAKILAGDATMRGDAPRTSGVRRLRADSRLTMVLTPVAPVDGALEARVYVRDASGLREAPGRPEVDAAGAVRLRGAVGTLLGVRSGTVAVVLRAARSLPNDPERALRTPGPRAEVQLIVQPTR